MFQYKRNAWKCTTDLIMPGPVTCLHILHAQALLAAVAKAWEMNGAGSGVVSDALPGQGIMPEAGLSRAGRVLTAAGMLDPSNSSLVGAASADTSYQLVPGEVCLALAALECCLMIDVIRPRLQHYEGFL